MSDQALLEASKEGDLNRVKYLVEVERVDVNSKDRPGQVIKSIFSLLFLILFQSNRTPLLHAALDNHLNVVEYLLDKGANINEKDSVFPHFHIKIQYNYFNHSLIS